MPKGTDPAFPTQRYDSGMTLRDYFAAKAMQAQICKYGFHAHDLDDLSAQSYAAADAMLAERERTQ